ncbi:MAG: hypothetical protein V4565_02990 [Bacteroidota bacterium]
MKKVCVLVPIIFGLFSCYKSRTITVKAMDVDTNSPVSGIQVIITDVQHHSSGNTETVIYTDGNGVATKQIIVPKKDIIKIQLNGQNGYSIIGESYNYYHYRRKTNIMVMVKK